MLTLDGITLRLGGQLILDHASASLPPKPHVGLVGRNGAGKSTLLKIIAGVYEADEGSVETPSGTRIGYVAQEAPGGKATPYETVLAAADERAELLAEAEHAHDPHRIGEIHERLNAIDAHGAPARAARILAGLGFDEAQQQPLDRFSGGWRMRVALAALLFSEPDLLLLDEPSNHLDLEAELWLKSFLKAYRATLVVVSHERDLLNNVVDHILHVEGGGPTLYRGNYNSFERQRSERPAQLEATAQQAGGQGREAAGLCRSLALQGAHRAPGAEPPQGARRDGADRRGRRDPTLVFDFPSPEELEAAADRARRTSRSAMSRHAGALAAGPAHRSRRPHRLRRAQRQRQDHLGAAARGSTGADGRPTVAAGQVAGRLFRAAPDRGAGGRRRRRCSTCSGCCPTPSPARCAGSSAASASPATRSMFRCGSSRAASGRGCRSR